MSPRSLLSKLLPTLLLAAAASTAHAATIWSGPAVMFEHVAFSDSSDPANQDLLVDGVALTRSIVRGLYNAAVEDEYLYGSPAGTEWAWTLNNPGLDASDITAANYANLTFDVWFDAHGGDPPATVGIPGVLHLIDADIYLDIEFTSWGKGIDGGGAFSYLRSTPVPEPASGALLGLGLVGLALGRPR